jgi:hypothetical protein
VPVPSFLLVLCFRKATQEIFSELDETKAEPPIFPEASRSPKMIQRGARTLPHPRAARPSPSLRHQGWAALVHLLTPPFRLYIPLDGKNLEPRSFFPQNLLQAAVIVDARLGGSRSSSRHPAGGLLHHHGRLRSDVWVVYLGLRVHSSS